MIYAPHVHSQKALHDQVAWRIQVAGGKPLAAALKAKNFVAGLLVLDDIFDLLAQYCPQNGRNLEGMRKILVDQLKGEFKYGLNQPLAGVARNA